MNFLKKQFTKFAKKKVKEIVSAPKDERNPQFQKLIDEAGGFLNKYTPGQIDATEFIEKALAKIDWVSFEINPVNHIGLVSKFFVKYFIEKIGKNIYT